jgi:hypothetical protein
MSMVAMLRQVAPAVGDIDKGTVAGPVIVPFAVIGWPDKDGGALLRSNKRPVRLAPGPQLDKAAGGRNAAFVKHALNLAYGKGTYGLLRAAAARAGGRRFGLVRISPGRRGHQESAAVEVLC